MNPSFDRTLRRLEFSRQKTLTYMAIWLSAALIGVLAVAYARLIGSAQHLFLRQFATHPILVSIASPFLFLLATAIVRYLAPDAKGSGIPQVMAAIDLAKKNKEGSEIWQSNLISLKTAFFKVISSTVGILGGASIGREGPTIQIAASAFAWIGHRIRKFAPQISFQSFLIAGASAGVAAAFNTPIAGITFAIEEIADNTFGSFKQIVMFAIIVSGLIAQGISGDYLYFGQPEAIPVSIFLLLWQSILIGLLGGLLGSCFAFLLAKPEFTRIPKHWILRALFAGTACALVGYFTSADTSGSGYEVTAKILNHGNIEDVSFTFPLLKLLTTVLSYLSGMAGGIFSPSLSIGAGTGMALAKLFGWINFKSCALTGMVAFFSGAVGAPLTGVIIVMEMTNEHKLVLPFMIAAYLGYTVSRRIMPVPLYHYLAHKHLEG